METLNIPARHPELWNQARARAGFKASLLSYLLVNALLWAIWAVTGHGHEETLPWPAWVSIFWGIGLMARAMRAYSGWSRHSLAEREYQRLLREQGTELQ